MIKINFFLVCFLLNAVMVIGQRDWNSNSSSKDSDFYYKQKDLAVYFGGGQSSFNFDPKIGSLDKGYGSLMGADITFWWKDLGFATGLRYSTYNSIYDLNDFTISSPSIDGDVIPEDFILNTHFSNFSEQLKAQSLAVPLLFSYRLNLNNDLLLQSGMGIQVTYVLSSVGKTVNGTYSTSGYYPLHGDNFVVEEGPGFQTYSMEQTNHYKHNIGLSAVANIELAYRINSKFRIAVGPYFEYQVFSENLGNVSLTSYHVQDVKNASVSYDGVMNSDQVASVNRIALGGRMALVYCIEPKR